MTSPQFVAESAAARALLTALGAHALADRPLWVIGPSGSGRGHAARWLHRQSPRAASTCLEVDCASLDTQQIDSSICGAQRGAVRGLFQARPGWFETARGGTLILHGVAHLSAADQLLLAQVLTDRRFTPLGAQQVQAIDSRLVLVSESSPQALQQGGRLIGVLAQALAGPEVRMPSLSERQDDIPALAAQLLAHHARALQQPAPNLTEAAIAALQAHDWPDNLRELDTCMQNLVIRHHEGMVGAEDLGLPGTMPSSASATGHTEPLRGSPAQAQLNLALSALMNAHPGEVHALVQAALYQHAYERTQGHQIKAARLLGVSRNVLRTKLIELGLIQARA